jgi:hypothetical protein
MASTWKVFPLPLSEFFRRSRCPISLVASWNSGPFWSSQCATWALKSFWCAHSRLLIKWFFMQTKAPRQIFTCVCVFCPQRCPRPRALWSSTQIGMTCDPLTWECGRRSSSPLRSSPKWGKFSNRHCVANLSRGPLATRFEHIKFAVIGSQLSANWGVCQGINLLLRCLNCTFTSRNEKHYMMQNI